MPNHCYNRVSLYSDDTTVILRLHEIFKIGLDPNDDRTVFGQFIPEPKWEEIPLTAETVQDYSWDKPKGEVGEKPVMVNNEDRPFLNGLRFKSTDRQDDRWYNWNCDNWGTKWNSINAEREICEYGDHVKYTFETAWAAPREILIALKEQYPDLQFNWFYRIEDWEDCGFLHREV